MKKLTYKKLVFFLFCGLLSLQGRGQQIKGQLTATEDGYHIIPLPEAFRAVLGNNTGMLRLKDKNGIEIPYVLKKAPESIVSFKSVQYKREPNQSDSTERITIANLKQEKWQSLTFRIANTKVQKRYTLAGSNDQQNWFSIESDGLLDDLNTINQTTVLKTISFPLNDYAYLQFIFDNKKTAPINILEIGFTTREQIKSKLDTLRTLKSTIVNDSKTKSTIIQFTKPYRLPIDLIQFHIATPKQYYRQAKIFSVLKNAKKQQSQHTQTAYFTLTEKNTAGYPVHNSYPETFSIVIDNEDNAPLQIDSISAYQLPIEIIADLKVGTDYVVEADSSWQAPNYDLDKVSLQLPANIPQAEITNIKLETVKALETETKENNRTLLIICSIIGVAIAFYFGRGLLKDLKKE